MNLKPVAQAVQNQGRGPDTMLVHMTPGEVNGLQQLAVANGGSLTINPETGLPEAGFLSSILPTLIGVGLAATGMGPLAAGLTVGGIQTVRTGDLGQGLMAGLGAYGGAGLGSAAAAAAPGATVSGTTAATGVTPTIGGVSATQAGGLAPANIIPKASGFTTPAMSAGVNQLATNSFTTNLSNMAAGAGNVFTDAGARAAGMKALGDTALGAVGTTGAALAGPLTYIPESEYKEGEKPVYEGPYLPTERKAKFPGKDRDPRDSSEFLYFEDTNPYPGFYPTNPLQPGDEGYDRSFASQYGPQYLYNLAEGGGIEKDYGFGAPPPMPANLPTAAGSYDEFVTQMAAQQAAEQAAKQAPVGLPLTPDGREPSQGGVIDIGNEPMQPGLDAMIGRSFHQNPLAHAILPGGIMLGEAADRSMAKKGMTYDSMSSDYANRDYVGGGSAGYENLGQEVDPTGRGNTNPDKDADPDETYFAYGGQVDMHNNGFVVDAKTVAEVGNGSSNAGMERFAQIGGQPIMGPGDGVSDSIPANIDGVQPAMVARDEVYMPPNAVKAYGGGSLKMGEKKLYALMDKAKQSRKSTGRGQKTGLKSLVG